MSRKDNGHNAAFYDKDLAYCNEAIDLLDEYENQLINGKNVDPRGYLSKYDGLDKERFEIELKLITLLHRCSNRYKQKHAEVVTSGEWKKIDARICKKIFGEDK